MEAAAAPEQGGLRIAAFWRRAAARAVDTALLVGVAFAGWQVSGLFGATLAGAACSLWHPVFGHRKWGRTVGKALLGIRVVDSTGRTPTMERSVIRWFIDVGPTVGMVGVAAAWAFSMWFVFAWGDDGIPRITLPVAAALAVCYPILNFGALVVSRENQAIHDQAAGTWVVRG